MTVVRRALTLFASAALSLSLAGPPRPRSRGACPPGRAPRLRSRPLPQALAPRPAADGHRLVRDRDAGQIARDLPQSAKGRAPSDFSVTVPVFWHVVTDGAAGAVTDAQILSQINALNLGFSGGEGGAATGFTFSLAGTTRTNNAVWYRAKSAGAEHDMKRTLKQGGDSALNVYSTSGGALLGYAYLPEITDTAQAYLDGIVIDWRTMPGVSTRVRRRL